MRLLLYHFIEHDLRQGPFLLTLTDIHQNKIFVDDEWNIRYIIDLEWACSLPAEMQQVPCWLTSQSIDSLLVENLSAFDCLREEFMAAFENEERNKLGSYGSKAGHTLMMRNGWETGKFWFYHALDSPLGLPGLFWQHIQPIFARSHINDPEFDRITSAYWIMDSDNSSAQRSRRKRIMTGNCVRYSI